MDDEISADELRPLLEDGTVRVVDIRSPTAFRQGHIPGSENVPLGELTGTIETFDGDDHVVTVCPHGKASVQAARLISSYEGFEGQVESLASGIEGWEGPLETGGGPPDNRASRAETDGGTDGSDIERTDRPDAPF